MNSQLTLLVPGLLAPPQSLQRLPEQEKHDFKILNRFFSRARQTNFPADGFYSSLFHLFGIESDEQTDHPVAALTYQIDANSRDDAWYLRCDPVYIHADMDRAVLMGHGALGLTTDETEQILMILNAHIEQDGWQIEAQTIDRWYVKGANKTQVKTTPPDKILGQDIKHDMPKGPDGAYWCSLMNECQMLLHDLPLNIDRQTRGLLPINSLWFWGGGQLPATGHCHYDRIFTDDVLIKGMAMMSGCTTDHSNEIWSTNNRHNNQNYLWVIDDLISPLIQHDLYAWLDAVKQFEQDVMKHILHLVKTRQLSEVTLLTADGRKFQLTRTWLRRWWKRQTKFSLLIEKAVS